MLSKISFQHMIKLGVGLMIAVVVILVTLVLPPTTIPEIAITPFWKKIIVHLLIGVALIWTFIIGKRGSNRMELLIISGVALLILALILSDYAFAYLGRPEQPFGVSLWLFVCIGFDIVAALLVLGAWYLHRSRSLSK